MKKLWTLMAMVAVFASCSQDETDSPLNTYTLTGYTDVESRTAFGTPGDTKIPFQWSAGDFIYNGTNKSNVLSNGGSSATFTFKGTPSSSEVYYNMTASSNTSPKQANVKPTQTVGNLGTNGDFGYGTVSNGSFTLNHATSYLWFDVTSSLSNVTLQSIKVSADVNIAGKATWSGSSFGAVTGGINSIELTVNQALSSTNSNVWTMVVLPNLASKSFKVTYKLKVGNNTKYCSQTVTGKSNFTSGKTQKVAMNITNSTELTDYAELRVLTFEDGSEKFTPYNLDYADVTISKWSDLIDEPEYMGLLNYGDISNAEYTWYDMGNTELTHTFPYNYNAYCFWGGGHAISNYASTDYVTNGTYENQLTVYGEEGAGGHNGSSNFCMHFGYIDGSPWNETENLPALSFGDDVPRVIDHMYVNNSTYAINCYMNGNGLTANIGPSDWVKLLATGYDANDNETGTLEFYMVNGPNHIITEWTKWDLSGLGKVLRVEFNITGSSDNGYGYSQPAYFAYDDVAVRFE